MSADGTRAFPTNQAPSNSEIRSEKNPTRQAILSAMQRILSGVPKRVPSGALTTRDLAFEAEVGRHHLYQSHPDLRQRFEFLREREGTRPEREVALQEALERARSQAVRHKDSQQRARQEADDWKELVEVLARVINALQEEIHQEQIKVERLTRRLHEPGSSHRPTVVPITKYSAGGKDVPIA
ncbi:hypothetical protein GC088_10055 [Arthrobacter sp. JZ12]|uniref:hypothetical protein n=1 Tax=Arthrobacter sp. JZ12 TaxID=2654190 RepID=UPI002B465FC4|nr:hypothetical protein [Arthrobacter sp. JZ12]WRH25370.1 hypothetical protein GC088_10055 [Arthrobacter sp. JZ12]